MTASSHKPASERSVVAAAFAAIALFVVSWTLLHVGFYKNKQLIDTPIYQRYGNAIADGKIPYRDFALEYPPGALPVFALPGLAEPGSGQQVSTGFRRSFETIMWLCGAAALAAMAVVLRVLRRSTANVWASLCFAATAPLLLGSVVLSRFDLWPAAIVAAALAALVSGRLRLGHALIGLGVTAKLYPAALLPLGVVYVWRREDRREALTCLGLALAVVVAVFAPFVILSPGGVWQSLTIQLNRPLQVESLGAALLLAGHHLFGFRVTGVTSHGSQNLGGAAADALAIASTVLQAALLVWIWTSFARGPGSREALVRSAVASLCTFVAFGKVLSPQFLVWLIPVVPLVRGRRGLLAGALLAVALVLTQTWFPYHYFRLALNFEEGLSWWLLTRDLTLVALAVTLLLGLRRRTAY
jgi:glycosyl transferase family 87